MPCTPGLCSSQVGNVSCQVGPRQICAQLLTGSGPCTWDLDALIPEEDLLDLKERGGNLFLYLLLAGGLEHSLFFHILDSYFSKGWLNHQADLFLVIQEIVLE